jgi:hypothetical protein
LTAGRKADWDAFKKDFLEKAQKDFGNSNIKLQYTFTDGDDPQVTGTKSDSLNFGVSDHLGGTEKSHDPVEDFFRNERIDPSNTFQGWGARQSAYRERT